MYRISFLHFSRLRIYLLNGEKMLGYFRKKPVMKRTEQKWMAYCRYSCLQERSIVVGPDGQCRKCLHTLQQLGDVRALYSEEFRSCP